MKTAGLLEHWWGLFDTFVWESTSNQRDPTRLGSTLEYWLRLSQKILSEGTSAHLEPPGRKIVRDSGNFLTLPAHLGLIVIIHAKGACLHWFHAFCSWFQIFHREIWLHIQFKMKTKTFFQYALLMIYFWYKTWSGEIMFPIPLICVVAFCGFENCRKEN